MNSTVYFKTKNNFSYYYDMKKMYLLNIHPVIEAIRQQDESDTLADKEGYFLSLFPELSSHDISYYIQKYKFLKEKGFFSSLETRNYVSGRINGEIVEQQISNVDSILFQVTGKCNLKCKYCCYGDLYMDANLDTLISLSSVQRFFEYIAKYWESSHHLSYNHPIRIGFYGGEPLVNFKLIEEIVTLATEYGRKYGIDFTYSMTTNGVLLDKYQDFIAKHDFKLLISLDGNEVNDQLRVDANNRPSFQRVFKNVKGLMKDYPDYFTKSVEFNSVLNQYSTVEEIHDFIFNEFGKIPLIEPVSLNELNEEKQEEYKAIYSPYVEPPSLLPKRKERSPLYKELGFFFYYQLNNSYKHYCELLYQKTRYKKRIPTGTCIPFFKKIFISSDNHIYACERIGLQYILGSIDEEVHIDFNKIATLYNNYFEKIESQCNSCYSVADCGQCLFQMPMKNGIPVCPTRMNKKEYQKYLSALFSILEDNKSLVNEINKIIFA